MFTRADFIIVKEIVMKFEESAMTLPDICCLSQKSAY